MTDAYIQVPLDQAGKRVETTEITRGDGVVVERQRMDVDDSLADVKSILEKIALEVKLIRTFLSAHR